jgi:transcriptional regulator with XRE-family HTH domain
MDLTMQRIVDEMELQKKQQIELGEHLGVTPNIITDWKSGRLKSYKKYLHGIADFLGVSVEYLRGETDEKMKPPVNEDEGLTNEERLLLALFNQIPKEKKSEAISKIIEALNN